MIFETKDNVMLKIAVLFAVLASFSSYAQRGDKNVGVGFILGSPTALSAKFFQNRTQAWDAGLSFSSNRILLLGDYLQHFPGALSRRDEFIRDLTPYIGVGPILSIRTSNKKESLRNDGLARDDNFSLGGRVPLGIEWLSRQIPIGISLEIAPGIVILPTTTGIFQAGLAIRYYF
jgi:hypothetical protein